MPIIDMLAVLASDKEIKDSGLHGARPIEGDGSGDVLETGGLDSSQ